MSHRIINLFIFFYCGGIGLKIPPMFKITSIGSALKFDSITKCTRKKGFVTATKLGTTDKNFVAATKHFATATKRFVDRTKHFVVVAKWFFYPYFSR